MKARGKFIGDKIDLLVSYLVVHPFLRLYSKLPQKVKVCRLDWAQRCCMPRCRCKAVCR